MINWHSISVRKRKLLNQLVDADEAGNFDIDFNHKCRSVTVDPVTQKPLDPRKIVSGLKEVYNDIRPSHERRPRSAGASSVASIGSTCGSDGDVDAFEASAEGEIARMKAARRAKRRGKSGSSRTQRRGPVLPGDLSEQRQKSLLSIKQYVRVIDDAFRELRNFLRPAPVGDVADVTTSLYKASGPAVDLGGLKTAGAGHDGLRDTHLYLQSLVGLRGGELATDEVIWEVLASHVVRLHAVARGKLRDLLLEPLHPDEFQALKFERADILDRSTIMEAIAREFVRPGTGASSIERRSVIEKKVGETLQEFSGSRHGVRWVTLASVISTVKTVLDRENNSIRKRQRQQNKAAMAFDMSFQTVAAAAENTELTEVSELLRNCMRNTAAVQKNVLLTLGEMQQAMGGTSKMPPLDNSVREVLSSTSNLAKTLWDLCVWVCDEGAMRTSDCDLESNEITRNIRQISKGQEHLDALLKQDEPKRNARRGRAKKTFEGCVANLEKIVKSADWGKNARVSVLANLRPQEVKEPPKMHTVQDLAELSGLPMETLDNMFQLPGTNKEGEEGEEEEPAENAAHSSGSHPAPKAEVKEPEPAAAFISESARRRVYTKEERLLQTHARLLETLRQREVILNKQAGRVAENLQFKLERSVRKEVQQEVAAREEEDRRQRYDMAKRLNMTRSKHQITREATFEQLNTARKQLERWELMMEIHVLKGKLQTLRDTRNVAEMRAAKIEEEVGDLKGVITDAVNTCLNAKLGPCRVHEKSLKLLEDPCEGRPPEESRERIAFLVQTFLLTDRALPVGTTDSFLQQAADISTHISASLSQQGLHGAMVHERVQKALGKPGKAKGTRMSQLKRATVEGSSEALPRTREDHGEWEAAWLGVCDGLGPRSLFLRNHDSCHIHCLEDVVDRIGLVEQKRIEPLPRYYDGFAEFALQLSALERAAERMLKYWQQAEPIKACSEEKTSMEYLGKGWSNSLLSIAKEVSIGVRHLSSALGAVSALHRATGVAWETIHNSHTQNNLEGSDNLDMSGPDGELHFTLKSSSQAKDPNQDEPESRAFARGCVLKRVCWTLTTWFNSLAATLESMRNGVNLHMVIVTLTKQYVSACADHGSFTFREKRYKLGEAPLHALLNKVLGGVLSMMKLAEELREVSLRPAALMKNLDNVIAVARRVQTARPVETFYANQLKSIVESSLYQPMLEYEKILNRQLSGVLGMLTDACRAIDDDDERTQEMFLADGIRGMDWLLHFWWLEVWLLGRVSNGSLFRKWRQRLRRLFSGKTAPPKGKNDAAFPNELARFEGFCPRLPTAAQLEDWSAVLQAERQVLTNLLTPAEFVGIIWTLGEQALTGMFEPMLLDECRPRLFPDSGAGPPVAWGFGAVTDMDLELRLLLGAYDRGKAVDFDDMLSLKSGITRILDEEDHHRGSEAWMGDHEEHSNHSSIPFEDERHDHDFPEVDTEKTDNFLNISELPDICITPIPPESGQDKDEHDTKWAGFMLEHRRATGAPTEHFEDADGILGMSRPESKRSETSDSLSVAAAPGTIAGTLTDRGKMLREQIQGFTALASQGDANALAASTKLQEIQQIAESLKEELHKAAEPHHNELSASGKLQLSKPSTASSKTNSRPASRTKSKQASSRPTSKAGEKPGSPGKRVMINESEKADQKALARASEEIQELLKSVEKLDEDGAVRVAVERVQAQNQASEVLTSFEESATRMAELEQKLASAIDSMPAEEVARLKKEHAEGMHEHAELSRKLMEVCQKAADLSLDALREAEDEGGEAHDSHNGKSQAVLDMRSSAAKARLMLAAAQQKVVADEVRIEEWCKEHEDAINEAEDDVGTMKHALEELHEPGKQIRRAMRLGSVLVTDVQNSDAEPDSGNSATSRLEALRLQSEVLDAETKVAETKMKQAQSESQLEKASAALAQINERLADEDLDEDDREELEAQKLDYETEAQSLERDLLPQRMDMIQSMSQSLRKRATIQRGHIEANTKALVSEIDKKKSATADMIKGGYDKTPGRHWGSMRQHLQEQQQNGVTSYIQNLVGRQKTMKERAEVQQSEAVAQLTELAKLEEKAAEGHGTQSEAIMQKLEDTRNVVLNSVEEIQLEQRELVAAQVQALQAVAAARAEQVAQLQQQLAYEEERYGMQDAVIEAVLANDAPVDRSSISKMQALPPGKDARSSATNFKEVNTGSIEVAIVAPHGAVVKLTGPQADSTIAAGDSTGAADDTEAGTVGQSSSVGQEGTSEDPSSAPPRSTSDEAAAANSYHSSASSADSGTDDVAKTDDLVELTMMMRDRFVTRCELVQAEADTEIAHKDAYDLVVSQLESEAQTAKVLSSCVENRAAAKPEEVHQSHDIMLAKAQAVGEMKMKQLEREKAFVQHKTKMARSNIEDLQRLEALAKKVKMQQVASSSGSASGEAQSHQSTLQKTKSKPGIASPPRSAGVNRPPTGGSTSRPGTSDSVGEGVIDVFETIEKGQPVTLARVQEALRIQKKELEALEVKDDETTEQILEQKVLMSQRQLQHVEKRRQESPPPPRNKWKSAARRVLKKLPQKPSRENSAEHSNRQDSPQAAAPRASASRHAGADPASPGRVSSTRFSSSDGAASRSSVGKISSNEGGASRASATRFSSSEGAQPRVSASHFSSSEGAHEDGPSASDSRFSTSEGVPPQVNAAHFDNEASYHDGEASADPHHENEEADPKKRSLKSVAFVAAANRRSSAQRKSSRRVLEGRSDEDAGKGAGPPRHSASTGGSDNRSTSSLDNATEVEETSPSQSALDRRQSAMYNFPRGRVRKSLVHGAVHEDVASAAPAGRLSVHQSMMPGLHDIARLHEADAAHHPHADASNALSLSITGASAASSSVTPNFKAPDLHLDEDEDDDDDEEEDDVQHESQDDTEDAENAASVELLEVAMQASEAALELEKHRMTVYERKLGRANKQITEASKQLHQTERAVNQKPGSRGKDGATLNLSDKWKNVQTALAEPELGATDELAEQLEMFRDAVDPEAAGDLEKKDDDFLKKLREMQLAEAEEEREEARAMVEAQALLVTELQLKQDLASKQLQNAHASRPPSSGLSPKGSMQFAGASGGFHSQPPSASGASDDSSNWGQTQKQSDIWGQAFLRPQDSLQPWGASAQDSESAEFGQKHTNVPVLPMSGTSSQRPTASPRPAASPRSATRSPRPVVPQRPAASPTPGSASLSVPKAAASGGRLLSPSTTLTQPGPSRPASSMSLGGYLTAATGDKSQLNNSKWASYLFGGEEASGDVMRTSSSKFDVGTAFKGRFLHQDGMDNEKAGTETTAAPAPKGHPGAFAQSYMNLTQSGPHGGGVASYLNQAGKSPFQSPFQCPELFAGQPKPPVSPKQDLKKLGEKKVLAKERILKVKRKQVARQKETIRLLDTKLQTVNNKEAMDEWSLAHQEQLRESLNDMIFQAKKKLEVAQKDAQEAEKELKEAAGQAGHLNEVGKQVAKEIDEKYRSWEVVSSKVQNDLLLYNVFECWAMLVHAGEDAESTAEDGENQAAADGAKHVTFSVFEPMQRGRQHARHAVVLQAHDMNSLASTKKRRASIMPSSEEMEDLESFADQGRWGRRTSGKKKNSNANAVDLKVGFNRHESEGKAMSEDGADDKRDRADSSASSGSSGVPPDSKEYDRKKSSMMPRISRPSGWQETQKRDTFASDREGERLMKKEIKKRGTRIYMDMIQSADTESGSQQEDLERNRLLRAPRTLLDEETDDSLRSRDWEYIDELADERWRRALWRAGELDDEFYRSEWEADESRGGLTHSSAQMFGSSALTKLPPLYHARTRGDQEDWAAPWWILDYAAEAAAAKVRVDIKASQGYAAMHHPADRVSPNFWPEHRSGVVPLPPIGSVDTGYKDMAWLPQVLGKPHPALAPETSAQKRSKPWERPQDPALLSSESFYKRRIDELTQENPWRPRLKPSALGSQSARGPSGRHAAPEELGGAQSARGPGERSTAAGVLQSIQGARGQGLSPPPFAQPAEVGVETYAALSSFGNSDPHTQGVLVSRPPEVLKAVSRKSMHENSGKSLAHVSTAASLEDLGVAEVWQECLREVNPRSMDTPPKLDPRSLGSLPDHAGPRRKGQPDGALAPVHGTPARVDLPKSARGEGPKRPAKGPRFVVQSARATAHP